MTTDQLTTARPMRADARRNRALILRGARLAFTEDGPDVPMSRVAARSGVGVGTLYRHFATKEQLLTALAAEHLGAIAGFAEEELAARASPGERFERFMLRSAEMHAADSTFADLVWSLPDDVQAGLGERERLFAAAAALLDGAREAGELRGDAEFSDIPTIMCALGPVIQGGNDWRRYMRIALDGMRPPAGPRSR